MRLSRRDALAAIAATGAAVGGGYVLFDGEETGPLAPTERRILVGAAEVIYPSEVTDVEPFVRRFLRGRAQARPEHAAAVGRAARTLDEYSRVRYDEAFTALDAAGRDAVLRGMNLDAVEADPSGNDTQRVRHYVVDELLFALYSTPTGSSLVGLENPPGHPGGTTSYQEGPG